MSLIKIDTIRGTAVPVRGDDIDTDRIIPARYLRAVTFDGLEQHVFEDDRKEATAQSTVHPFSNPVYRGAAILIVNMNFGCGSSREHAPQALYRWGIRAVVGESFSEIFFGNSVALGMPCLTLDHDAILSLLARVEAVPKTEVTVSVADATVTIDGRTIAGRLTRSAQEALLSGFWDPTALLVDHFEQVEAVAAGLPYIKGY